MQKTNNLQEIFLTRARKQNIPVTMFLVNGFQLRGIITGFTATVDPAVMGMTLQVLVSVTIRSGARQRISEFSEELRALPEVLQLFFLGGPQVAATASDLVNTATQAIALVRSRSWTAIPALIAAISTKAACSAVGAWYSLISSMPRTRT